MEFWQTSHIGNVMSNDRRGFSLIEIIVALAVFLLFAVGIYSGTIFVFKVVYQSRLRILETGILNEQVEIVHNLPFHDVGIIAGSPSGILPRTVTTTRNGILFTITRTVRNIDDPFDGTIGGTPNDTAPADFKLVEVEIVCAACNQRAPAIMSTIIGPQSLEGNRYNGALFIRVFDAAAVAVAGATVHIVATSTSTTVDLTDVTNNSGQLNTVDLPAGIGAYHITVTKSGYTSDGTMASSVAVPNPVKPPASVVAQDVTSVSFEIDRVSRIDLETMNSVCQAVGGVPVDAVGTKLIGTDPNILLVSSTVTTNGSGDYTLDNLVWDAYGLRPRNYDLRGSIPPLPLSLGPNVTQEVDLILGADQTHSLLVTVLDSVTRQSVANATVTVTSTGYSARAQTGYGSVDQTDWSGGSGQDLMGDPARYWSDDGRVDVSSSAGDIILRRVGNHYVNDGQLKSSIFDLGTSANPFNLTWEPVTQPPETGSTSIRFRLATSNTTTPAAWNYLGPDGTNNSYYTASTPVIHDAHDGNRYLRYQAYLSTSDNDFTPTLSDVFVSYTSSCTPPGQAYFGPLSNQTYGITVTHPGYQTRTETLEVSGDVRLSVDLVGQ